MIPSVLLLHIIGGVCLLLFGLRLVRSGVTRALGAQLRTFVEKSTSNRIKAFFSGIFVTALLQSSTAVTMIISSFAGQGVIATTAALAVILGADVGTTLVAQVLTFDLAWLSPVLITAGYFAYAGRDQSSIWRQLGRIVLGFGLMMLALSVIKTSAVPLKESETLPLILKPLADDPVFAVLVAALMTWLFHSTLATVLLFMSMVHADVLPLNLALVMVLGANIGGVIGPLMASLKDSPAAVRIPCGNLVMRLAGVALIIGFVDNAIEYLKILSPDPVRMVVNFHMLFNIGLAVLFLPLLGIITRIVTYAVPDRINPDDVSRPKYLDDSALDTPSVALTNASRESIRMAELLDVMLRTAWEAFQKNDQALIVKAKATDKDIDKLYKAIKAHLVRLGSETMTKEESKRHFQILNFATNLEHIGDVIDKNLLPLAEKKIRTGVAFSEQGLRELNELARLVMDSIRLAQTVFISGDTKLARQIVEDKAQIKQAEIQASMNHMARLQQGIPETIATSDLHMDVIRDLRRINSMISSIAYPILEEAGELRSSVLRDVSVEKG